MLANYTYKNITITNIPVMPVGTQKRNSLMTSGVAKKVVCILNLFGDGACETGPVDIDFNINIVGYEDTLLYKA